MIYLYYILGFATGYVIRGIVDDVKRRLREYPLQQAMCEQQLRCIKELKKRDERAGL